MGGLTLAKQSKKPVSGGSPNQSRERGDINWPVNTRLAATVQSNPKNKHHFKGQYDFDR